METVIDVNFIQIQFQFNNYMIKTETDDGWTDLFNLQIRKFFFQNLKSN